MRRRSLLDEKYKKLAICDSNCYICARFEKSYVSDRLNEFVAFFMPTINGGEHDR